VSDEKVVEDALSDPENWKKHHIDMCSAGGIVVGRLRFDRFMQLITFHIADEIKTEVRAAIQAQFDHQPIPGEKIQ